MLDFKQLVESAKQVKLEPAAKQQLEDRVILYMTKHPLKKKPTWLLGNLTWLDIKEIITLKPLAVNFKYVAVIIMLVVVTVSGTSWAAEGAVPGDILYTVKVNVNEAARNILAVSSEAKAEVSVWQAERRLEEAEELAVQGKLDSSKQAELSARFEDHATQFEKNKNQLDGTPPGLLKVSTNSNFEGVLKGHAEVLGNLTEREDDNYGEVKPILEKVQARITIAEQNREQGERGLVNGNADFQNAAQGRQTAAQNKLREVKFYIEQVRISDTNKEEVLLQLADAQKILDEGKTVLNEGEYLGAISKFQASMRMAQEAKLQASAAAKLKINLRARSRGNQADNENDNKDEGGSSRAQNQDSASGDQGTNSQLNEDNERSKDNSLDDNSSGEGEASVKIESDINLNLDLDL